ncbi:UbiA family prenyltransferase [Georgenia sp. 10Sc9-8]|uniref:UbiA family prenyltransferase n=1 Tax=Georgenia halotolerans TaxID=3028317 RepID=A0ABT5U048_9MICO|nr:UbiA family prenyltransferase [Georgenia halotolerans]
MTTAADLAELVRLPGALTVPGDVLAGAAAAGWPAGGRTAVLPAASVCLYWAGMALNDYADRELDAVERPERPLPSGRVSPRTALGVGAGLSAAGLALAAAAGPRAVPPALALAGAVWSYDMLAKPTPAGPAVMAAARGLDVLLGAPGRPRAAALPALTVAGHVAAVTALSRGEVNGSSTRAAAGALATTAAVTVSTAVAGLRSPSPAARVGCLALSGLYAATVGRAQLAAVRDPSAPTVRAATGRGLRGLIPLQAAWAAAAGALPAAAGLLAAGPVARAGARRIATT